MQTSFIKKGFLLALVLAGTFRLANAQQTYYGALGFSRLYQTTLINPTLVPDSNHVKSSYNWGFLPVVGGLDMGVGVHFSAFTLGDFTSSIKEKTLDVNTLVGKMNSSSNADVYMGYNLSLFHAYFEIGPSGGGQRLEISQRLRTEMSTNFINKSLSGAFFGESETNKTIDLSGARFRQMSWNEIAVGYTRPINYRWTVGGRVKYLTGIMFAEMDADQAVIKMGADGNSLKMSGTMRTSGLGPIADSVYHHDLSNYKAKVGPNHGFAVDLGASYLWDYDIKMFFGINDLGFIRWAYSPITYKASGSVADFTPVQTGTGSGINFATNFDPIKDAFKQGSVSTSPFYASLSSYWHAGARWQYKPWLQVTSLVDFYLSQGYFVYPGATVAGTVCAGSWAEFSMNAGYNYGRFARVGMGTNFNWFLGVQPMRFFIFTSNVLGAFSAKNLQSFDLQVGVAWTYGAKKKKLANPSTDSHVAPIERTLFPK